MKITPLRFGSWCNRLQAGYFKIAKLIEIEFHHNKVFIFLYSAVYNSRLEKNIFNLPPNILFNVVLLYLLEGKHRGTLVCHLLQNLKVPIQASIKTKNLLS